MPRWVATPEKGPPHWGVMAQIVNPSGTPWPRGLRTPPRGYGRRRFHSVSVGEIGHLTSMHADTQAARTVSFVCRLCTR
jgi:hypothetical protein